MYRMATVTLTIPDTNYPEVLQSFADQYHYPATVTNPAYTAAVAAQPASGGGGSAPLPPATIPNPQTQDQFLVQRLLHFIEDVNAGWHVTKAVATAQTSAQAAAVVLSDDRKAGKN